MTAEIAVMNKGAIALAADSKVTVTSGGITKTYDTVSKLFTLSKVAPVGVMIYGNADFMDYPWETIIKLYRRQKGSAVEQTVADWGRDFFKFLDTFGNISEINKDENVYNICLSTILEAVISYEDWAISQGIAHVDPKYEEGLRASLSRRVERISQSAPWVAKRRRAAFVKLIAPHLTKATNEALEGYSDETKREGLLLAAGTLVLEVSSPQMSGIVIAGFGEKEYFPTLVEYHTDGYVGHGIKKYIVEPIMDVSRTFTACIRSFAQGEMVNRFMDGIDPYYSSYLTGAIPALVVDNCFDTLEKYGVKKNNTDAVKAKIREAVEKAVSGFESEAQAYRVERFSDPVIRMVSVLPKDELAHLAESLVALTSLKRRVSSDAETVGGPIDVALISKGDGFVWIKRKHYFKEELNPQFVRTYMNDLYDGEKHDADPRRAARSGGAAAARAARKPAAGRKA